ncbi:hypothetical protein DMB65_12185 [Flavobacterium cheongpyeongense]|uniref:Uncharacterized protein n=1 Tax=Flavobacterium cheongpyeongense TaxID=2212651 RepID=A0A2V4BRS6_9FLAO|nr:hypothetical protein DMB65_12185 [Flavobacterium cheongpyeongense]
MRTHLNINTKISQQKSKNDFYFFSLITEIHILKFLITEKVKYIESRKPTTTYLYLFVYN